VTPASGTVEPAAAPPAGPATATADREALLAGLAVWQTSRHPLTRAFAVAIPLSQSWAVVATANHWTLDAFAGIAVCAIAWLIVALSHRLSFRTPIQFDRG